MPLGLLKTLAKRYGVSEQRAETAWHNCKEGIQPGTGGKGYGLVVQCVKAKLAKAK